MSRDGALWINSPNRTIRYQPDTDPPDTEVELPFDEITQPGNVTVTWRGTDPWKATSDEALQYAWRLDEGEWSPFSSERSHLFILLSSGDHLLEVKAQSTVEVKTQDGNKIILDSSGITIEATSGKDLTLKATNIKIEAMAGVDVKANATLNVEGATTTVKGSATMTLDGGATLIAKGGTVMIN